MRGQSVINHQALRAAVLARGKSVGELAKEMDVDRSVLSKYLQGGEDRLSLEHFARLCIWLNESADKFIIWPTPSVDA